MTVTPINSETNTEIMMAKSELNPVAFGVSFGVLSAASIFILSLLSHVFFTGKPLVAGIGEIYLAYNPSLPISFFAAFVGFVNTFVFTYLVALIYNLIAPQFE